jgi:hypothetical protein
MITDQNRYAIVTDAMKAGRLENWANYITSPDKAPPKQPDPLNMQELQIKENAANASVSLPKRPL